MNDVREFDRHMYREHDLGTEHHCNKCDKTFKYLNYYLNHQRNHKDLNIICSTCGVSRKNQVGEFSLVLKVPVRQFSVFCWATFKIGFYQISGNSIFYIKQHKSLSTRIQKHHFWNSLYYSNELVTLEIDGRTYRRSDLWATLILL